MKTSGSKSDDDEDEKARIARRILAALRAAGVGAYVVEDVDDAPPIIPVLRASLTKTDWLADPFTKALAWRLPLVVIFAALLVPVPARVGIWAVAFAWMGTACVLNYRRCGRIHCRYTGPYYLAMIVPVLALGIAPVLIPITGWLAIAVAIPIGSKLIWWATERAWGKFSLS